MSKLKTVDIKGKEYVMVNERIAFFRTNEEFKGWSLESDIISLDDNSAVIKATIKDANGKMMATGIAREKEGDGYINKTSYVENCETSAWGRALGNLGIGIDTSIASADEVSNAMLNSGNTTTKKNDDNRPWLNEGSKEFKEIQLYIKNGQLTDVDQITKFNLSKKTKELLTKLITG